MKKSDVSSEQLLRRLDETRTLSNCACFVDSLPIDAQSNVDFGRLALLPSLDADLLDAHFVLRTTTSDGAKEFVPLAATLNAEELDAARCLVQRLARLGAHAAERKTRVLIDVNKGTGRGVMAVGTAEAAQPVCEPHA